MIKRTLGFFLFFWVMVIGAGQATMFWRPAEAAMERVYEILDPETPDISLPGGLSEEIRARLQKSGQAMPLGEYPSENLSTLAWEALKAREVTKVEAAAFWCLEVYGEEAGKLQAEFDADNNQYYTVLMTPGLTTMRPLVYAGEALWALGEAYRQAGREEEAVIVYSELIRNYYLSATERH
ncbi:MAG TPA: tetratricopeptide repeat protein [Candidatus Omnitrophota bacterium]|nr:tetratricopeptide repeat protein [Candidatus Omnitrophota bacterium]